MCTLFEINFPILASRSASVLEMASPSSSVQFGDCYNTWIHELRLSEQDRKSLQNHAWLSANHISAANMLLKTKFHHQNGLQDTSYLAEKLIWKSDVEKFIQIINVSRCHWACLTNKFSNERNTVQFYDSLMTSPNASVMEQACTILKCDQPTLKYRS